MTETLVPSNSIFMDSPQASVGLLAPLTPPGPTELIVSDSFGGSLAALHGRTTEIGGKTWSVTDGSAMRVSGTGHANLPGATPAIGHGVGTFDVGSPDGTLSGHGSSIQESGTGGRHGLTFRYVDDLNHWTLYNYRTGGGAEGYFLRGWAAGALSYDGGFQALSMSPFALKVVLLGTNIKAFINNALVANITNSLHQSATRHGICSHQFYGDVADVDYTSVKRVLYLDSTSIKASGNTVVTVPRPALSAVGDLLVAFYESRGVTNFTPPAGWTTVFEQDTAGGGDAISGTTIHVFYRFIQPGDPSSWTGMSSDNRAYGVGVVACSGAAATPITVYSGNGSQTPTTATFTGITVPKDNSLLIGACSIVGTITGNPVSTTERWDLGSGAGSQAAGDGWTKEVNAGATGNFDATTDSASPNAWTTVLVAVNPA